LPRLRDIWFSGIYRNGDGSHCPGWRRKWQCLHPEWNEGSLQT